MSTRTDMISRFYTEYDEETRLDRTRRGQLEFFVTMDYIHRYAGKNSKILEIGAGTGRYSIALAKEGLDVTSVELVENNLAVLKKNSEGLKNIQAFQGDALDLSRFSDETFGVTLVFGPMYHLYEPADIQRAIDEAVRVTKKGGVLLFAFISVFAIMAANYLYGNWAEGEEENFTPDKRIRHFEEQLFTGYDITEFEALFNEKPVEHLATAGVDWVLEAIQKRDDFSFSDEDFEKFKKWYLAFAENRE
ncbi:MAG: class I SAM-dependent methyltransferase, partial [Lachnospiraceae bacterium]|nr:class I SAM-dependent methyltransferase [Lachnospiraceae bacterium]